MQIDPEALKSAVPRLRDRGSLPPKEALLAFFALAHDGTEHLVTLQIDNGWQLVAVCGNALVVVTVDFGSTDGAFWSFDQARKPEGASVTGRYFTTRFVDWIEVGDPTVFGGWLDSNLDIRGYLRYAIHLNDGTVLDFARDQTDRENAVEDLVTLLRSRL